MIDSKIGIRHSEQTCPFKEDIYTAVGWESMYQNGYFAAAGQEALLNRLYTRLPGIHIKLLFTQKPFQSQFRYIHGNRVPIQNCYLHGSHSIAKSDIYIAAECIIKIVINTTAVQEPKQLNTLLLGVYIELLLARQPFKS